ncbi:MAG TPA: peptide ABC transporter substrate-binding protein [Clostridia bacterium]|nr:peptide ABC transporter substrate-binding protein [Clostridia bacterium]
MRKVISLFLITCLIAVGLTACGKSGQSGTKGSASNGKTASTDKLNLLMGPEPDTIDPGFILSSDGATYAFHVFEGLMRMGADNKLQPGAAESYEVSADKLTYTFHIRKDAKWSDGVPLKAQDFEYAWKRVLTPKTAAPYAYILYPVKNAQESLEGRVKVDQVGVKATDDRTLVVTLKAPTPYFLSICNFQATMPVRKDIIEKNGDKWTQSPATYIGNGPYKVTAWKHKEALDMTRNDNYWDAKSIAVKNLSWKLIEDDNAGLAAFESGELDGILNRHVPAAEVANFIKQGRVKVHSSSLGSDYFQVGLVKPSWNGIKDKRVRRALALAIDRTALCDNILRTGNKPAGAYVPYGITEPDGKDFRDVGGNNFLPLKADVTEAKKLLADAGYPDGKGVPTLLFTYNTATRNQKVAEFLQEQWKKNLNIDVKIQNEEWKVLIPERTGHNFTLTRGGWSADYIDPMTFLDMFIKGSGNNDPGFDNAEYNSLVAKAQNEADEKKRMQILHDAEKILMDELPIIPLDFTVEYTMQKDNVKGIYTSPLGVVFAMHAKIT